MDGAQIDVLAQRLVADPHDEEALAAAHQAGAADPKSYALLLERVGSETKDSGYASHWLSEAANVWSTTLGDAHRAARVLMQAIDRDPTQRTAADRLSQLYRDKGDVKALVALLERRSKALTPIASQDPEIRGELAGMHEELGRLWSESLQQPKKALENFRRSIDLDPSSAYAIYNAREIYKSLGQWDDAIAMYDAELALESDPARRVALLRDEATMRRSAGDLAGATDALARARKVDEQDTALQQEFASSIIERIGAGEPVSAQERTMGAELLVGLAEVYNGEHGLAYSAGALDVEPGHDRALQLYAYYARDLQREDDLATRYLAYIEANPTGAMAADARWLLEASYEAAGQFDNAIVVLEPLRTLGDGQATAKLHELYAHAGRRMPTIPPPIPAPKAPATGAAGSGAVRRVAMAPDKLNALLDAAQTLAASGKRADAFQKYREVLHANPAHPEALSWVQDYLRTKRDYPTLRDILLAAARSTDETPEGRKDRLREVASLCESSLRDMDGAIGAYKQLLAIDRNDENARVALTRILEKAQRWDDLANLLEQEAAAETDLEKKIVLEKKVAGLHEAKRRDLLSAAEAWERIAILTPDDDQAILTAAKAFEKAGAVDRAANVIASNASGVTDADSRAALNEKLGSLREKLRDAAGAGEAYAEAADALRSAKLWEASERCFVAAEVWDRAGEVAVQRAHLGDDPKTRAVHFGRAAELFGRIGDDANVVANLQQATDLDPATEGFAQQLSTYYRDAARWTDLVDFLQKRASHLSDKTRRVEARRQAAQIYANELSDNDAAREAWRKVLEDGDDPEALERLVADAVEREDFAEATGLLQRLEKTASDKPHKAQIALREAELQAEGVGDVGVAIDHYERILKELDPTCRPALQAIADLQEAGDNPQAAAQALERELKLVSEEPERGPIAARLANLYEQMGDLKNAVKALEVVRKADPDDFDALARLCDLCEKIEEWGKVAELLAQRIEIEADEAEMSILTRKLSSVLVDKLERGDEALAVLSELADQGDADVREAYVALGDKLGWRGIVATKLVAWWLEAKPSAERVTNLRGAFDRFAEVGRDEDAVKVGCEVAKSKGGDRELADRLEQLSVKIRDIDALSVAHDLIVREMTGGDRARELVRQAEARVQAGAPKSEALQHGETGLTSIAPSEAEELLVRLSAIATTPGEVVDLYERQVTRCKTPSDRVDALARAAQVAATKDQIERARGFFDLALSGSPADEALEVLEDAAGEGDVELGGDALRRSLCAAMANGGQGARDGGRTRGALLRRAALIAYRDLEDVDQAFGWLGDALIAFVDPPTLDALEGLAQQLGEPQRAEATLSRALAEVFDGPLVRQLLSRRAKLRRDALSDKKGAAADLRRLYDLSPHETAVMSELSTLLGELQDYRGIVQVFEDQILRGKDMAARAELARKVARMWEQELSDPREAADAWRRVLRMKQGDAEATAGLERAKVNMLKKPPASREAALEAVDPGSQTGDSEDPPPPRIQMPEPAPAEAAEDDGDGGADASDDEDTSVHGSSPDAGGGVYARSQEHERDSFDPDATPLPAESPSDDADGPPAEDEVAAVPAPKESESLLVDLEAAEGAAAVDDGAEEIDVDLDESEEPQEQPPVVPKRTVPPPLPRS